MERPVIVAGEGERRGLYERLELLTADLRVYAPPERLVLEVKPRLEARAVQRSFAGVRLVVEPQQALRYAVMNLYRALQLIGHEHRTRGH